MFAFIFFPEPFLENGIVRANGSNVHSIQFKLYAMYAMYVVWMQWQTKRRVALHVRHDHIKLLLLLPYYNWNGNSYSFNDHQKIKWQQQQQRQSNKSTIYQLLRDFIYFLFNAHCSLDGVLSAWKISGRMRHDRRLLDCMQLNNCWTDIVPPSHFYI